ncbi:hypothetical protein [Bradyrhizobium sp. JYMT SZCCT0428]|uniref:hypothetical protein n=1 Tax=Bradyrhizobium sp. JYMT SZCCT0428 TaxID=2807673 RepID=UPI001BACF8E6|nr:hypothetical protein [Bradyrhizobium sp. JYMT SZCCT0428]MBR1153150.1 hypothetical protein [Bradyrhizobium sp. JYMT SZCCT0428]
MAGLTVRELAERIASKDDSLSTITERIRHWTDEDMLTVIGDKNPGTGKKRLYDPKKALVEALILTIMSEAVGHAVTTPAFIKVFGTARKDEDFALHSAKGPGERFLVVAHDRQRGASIGPEWGENLLPSLAVSKFEAHVVLDLWKVHQRAGVLKDG